MIDVMFAEQQRRQPFYGHLHLY